MDNSSFKTATLTTNADQESTSPSTLRDSANPRRPQKKVRKFPSFIRKISDEWSHFLVKIRQISDLNLTDEEFLESLFETSDEEFFPAHTRTRANPTLTAAETQFLLDYKRLNSLEKVAEQSKNLSGHCLTEKYLSSAGEKSMLASPLLTSSPSGDQDKPRFSPFQHTDMYGNAVEDDNGEAEENPGQALWEQRRKQWLTPSSDVDTEDKRNERIAQSTIKHISKDMYPRIYKDFMDKCKPLKKGRAINLEDFIAIINSGWTAEKKWERAAQGLP